MPTPNSKKHQILFVDDDRAFLETISQLFVLWSKETWQVHLAQNTARGLAILQEQPVEMVVMDIKMPVMDGTQFLQLLNRKYPNLPKVVMTGYATDEYRTLCLNNGVEMFLEKPRSSEEMETVFVTLNELVSWQSQEGFRGVLRQVGLQDVLQMECLGRNSSILEVANAQVRGRIYIEHGSIIHSEAGEIKGEEAINCLLALRGGDFNLKPYEEPAERTIQGSWEFLLMEAARMRDEQVEQIAETADASATESPELVPEDEAPDISPANEPDAEPAATASETLATRIDEVVVCSAEGDVLYQWECKDIEARLKLFQFIAQKAGQLNQSFPLGRFDRLEILGPDGRVIAQIQSDRKLFVRCSQTPLEVAV